MKYENLIQEIERKYKIDSMKVAAIYTDEVYIDVSLEDFNSICAALHEKLKSAVMTLFAVDEGSERGLFTIICVFMGVEYKKWFLARTRINRDNPRFASLSKQIYSAAFLEREMKEMFGIELIDNPDARSLRLHEEVWTEKNYPLRKDFTPSSGKDKTKKEYIFNRIEGEGVFEVPVGPVHAGIIGPGHFRFSAAGEPIINLETRLGFTHRGIEKLFEGKKTGEAVKIAEHVCGDSSFSHSLAFCRAVEKISGIIVPARDAYSREIFLELERLYNHIADIGAIALDVGFSFPSAYASIIKESLLALNRKLTGSRYLKGINTIGGVRKCLSETDALFLRESLKSILKDFVELKNILHSSVSFMDRVDGTGILKKKTAEDLGVVGLVGRASGIKRDLRKDFPGVYGNVRFNIAYQDNGDVLSRLHVRISEFEESVFLIKQFIEKLTEDNKNLTGEPNPREGAGLGYVEGWRGPVLYWVKLGESGLIERCKITDPSFHNWQGLSYAVLGNIIPDFPVCNKSFNLSYSGNDL